MGLLSPEAKTALREGTRVAAFVDLQFSPTPECYWSGVHPFSWDSKTWQPTAGLATVSEIDSSTDFRANGLTLQVNGLPADALKAGTLTPANFKGRPARFILALLSPAMSVIWSRQSHYFIDTLTYRASGEGAMCQITLEHEVAHAVRSANRYYSDEQQKREFPGDDGFFLLSSLATGLEIRWGAYGATFSQPAKSQ